VLTHQATGEIIAAHAAHAAGWKFAKGQAHERVSKKNFGVMWNFQKAGLL
jgi:hypothetical protein